MRIGTTFVALAAIWSANIGQAQNLNEILRAAINADGHSCEEITATNPIAGTSSGGVVIGAACSGGEQYAIEVNSEAEIKSVTRCATFESVTGMSCF